MRSVNCFNADASFGPQVSPLCRTFDFTRTFEESIFVIAPSAIFVAFAASRTWQIVLERPIIRRGWLYNAKLTTIAFLVAVEIVQLTLWATHKSRTTHTTIPSGVLAIIVMVSILLLSHLEHRRSFRPSSLLCTYLFVTLVLDIPQARTLLTSSQWRTNSIVFLTAMVLKVAILLLESQDKTILFLSYAQTWSPEETANVFSRRVFWWLNKLFRRGYHKALTMGDLFIIDQTVSGHELGNQLQSAWNRHRHKLGKHTLAWCIARTFTSPIIAPVLPRLLLTGFTFAQPFLVHSVTNFLKRDRDSAPDNWGYGLIGAYALVYSGIALSNGWYWHQQYRLITMVRGSLVAVIYSKTMRIELVSASASEATTLMSADVERIATGLRGMHELWAMMLEVGVGFWLLYRQVGLAMLSMAGLTLVCTFGASGIARYATVRQKAWMEAMQLRLSETIKMIASIKSIKMLGLEDRLETIIAKLRRKEIDACVHFRYATTAVVVLAHVNLFINPALIFSAFLPMSVHRSLRFDTERVFNTLTLVALVSEPLQNLLQSLPQLTMALGCVGRIQAYLLTADHHDVTRSSSQSSCQQNTDEKSEDFSEPDAYLLHNAHFAWERNKAAVLRNLNINIPTGKLTVVVGPVGSGKTSLLHSLLGECNRVKGSVIYSQGPVAFCAQQPWLSNTTVRSNIIGPAEDDSAWFDIVISACSLRRDIHGMPHGDQTLVGSGGAALSGGQKQRIALARALYARKPVLLLDDVFSGLDLLTEQSVFDALFGANGLFKTTLSNTTTIIATHAVRHLSFADHVVILQPEGEGAVQGSFPDLIATNMLKEAEVKKKSKREDEPDNMRDAHPSSEARLASFKAQDDKNAHEEVVPDKDVLAFYMKSMGFWHGVLFMALGVFCVGLWKVSDYWVRVWSEHEEHNPLNSRNPFYIGIYAVLNLSALIAASLWFAHFLLVVIPRTGITLHERILKSVLGATYPFLSRTDSGSLAARFGQDLLLIDTELPMAFVNTFFEIFVLIAQLGLIASASLYLLASFPLLALVVYIVQRVYLRTSKRIRHLDLEAKAPLYAQFTDTLAGIVTIRAFGWETGFKAESNRLLNNSQRPFYLLFCVQRWLECVLDFTVAALAVIVMGVAVGTRSATGGAKMGVALLNIVTLGEHLKALVKFWTMLETTITAAARIKSFVGTTPQEPGPIEEGYSEDETEQNSGMSIKLENISARYSEDGRNVISSVSLDIAPGEKVAICGRSGSGKSSLLSTLLKMLDLSDGQILINERPSASLGNRQLRQRLATIPQDPYFHPGTVRENLDPDRLFTDSDIEARLAKVGLCTKIAEIGGVNATLAIETFSAGQLQLLSQLRVVLRPKGIILFDEATSNVDAETDSKMHEVIFEDLQDRTVVAILHRREQLHRFDRVIVMADGRIVNVGKYAEVEKSI